MLTNVDYLSLHNLPTPLSPEADARNGEMQLLSTRSLQAQYSATFAASPEDSRPDALRQKAFNAPRDRSNNSSGRVSTDGVTLQAMLTYLVERRGFEGLFTLTNLRCFANRPTLSSSMKALRQDSMEWARRKIEYLYIEDIKKDHSRS